MKNLKLKPTDNAHAGVLIKSSSKKNKNSNPSMQSHQLMILFEEELKDIFWIEKELTKAIPKLISNATSEELIEVLTTNLEETYQQVERIAKVYATIDKRPIAKKCEPMVGLIKESVAIIENCEEGPMCDAGIISAGQKVEHYEIATYGTLRQFAETLGLEDAVELLQASLDEEIAADEKLAQIAVSEVNV